MTPEEFRKTILPEGRRLYALAFRYLNNRQEAEDTVQEVMMKLWEERNNNRFANTAAWCTTVTRNKCIDTLRRNKRLRLQDINEVEGAGEYGANHRSVSDDHEAAEMIGTIVSRMKEPYRSAVILRDMEGYSYEEAAEAIQTSINALRTMLSRARKKIRDEMERIYNYGTGEN